MAKLQHHCRVSVSSQGAEIEILGTEGDTLSLEMLIRMLAFLLFTRRCVTDV